MQDGCELVAGNAMMWVVDQGNKTPNILVGGGVKVTMSTSKFCFTSHRQVM